MSALDALQQLGTSHPHAGVAARERMAGTIAQLASHAARAGIPHLALATCNRHELYWIGELPFEAVTVPLAEGVLQHRVGEQAMAHLMAVAAGRESMVPGEPEVLGQVRRAWQAAREHGSSFGELDRCVRLAIGAARRVRRAASFAPHHESIASAGVAIALKAIPLPAARVAILGAGEAARAAAQAVRTADPAARVMVLARRADRAAVLAEFVGGGVRPWSALTEVIGQSALVIGATGARQPIVAATHLRDRRPGLVLLDLGVPRNIDPLVRSFAGVTLLDLDDIGRSRSSDAARELLDVVDRHLAAELDRIRREVDGSELPAMLSDLHAAGEDVALREAEALIDALGLSDDGDHALVHAALRRAVRRSLFPASRALRGATTPLG